MAINLPKGWHEVSIQKYLEYYTLLTSKIEDPLDLEVRIIACFSNLLTQDIENLKTGEIYKLAKQLSFLKELPNKKVPAFFTCGGENYQACLLMSDMTGGQFMNFNEVLKNTKSEDYIYHMADLIGAMCIKREVGIFFDKGKVSFVRYKYSGYKENAEWFNKHMSIAQAYPLYVFFCKVMDRLPTATQDYLIKETKKLMKKNRKKKRI